MLQRKNAFYPVTDISLCKEKMLCWLNRFSIFSFLDNHHYNDGHHSVECLAAAGAFSQFIPEENALLSIDNYLAAKNDWLFGHIGYGLKDEIFNTASAHADPVGFSNLFFFQPEIVLELKADGLFIASLTEEPDAVFRTIMQESIQVTNSSDAVQLHPVLSREAYIRIIEQLRQHILRGDCYEINFCQSFEANGAVIDPLDLYQQLIRLSPNPFSCLYRLQEKYLLCASPERYLQKKATSLFRNPSREPIRAILPIQQKMRR